MSSATRAVLLASLVVATGVHAADVDDLVIARRGNLPIVLTAPHGGRQAIAGVPTRTAPGVVITVDGRTLEVAEAVAARLKAMLGEEPYLVAARFHRRHLDANRKEADAYEDARAAPHYTAYHSRVREFVTEVRQRFPGGAILLDIHGQATDPDTLHRGTQNGATVARLIAKHGPEALIGERSILGVLQSRGHQVFPPNTPPGAPREERRYAGGHTVQIYGSMARNGTDAIQLELGTNQRTAPRFAEDLAEAIAVFYKAYLKGH